MSVLQAGLWVIFACLADGHLEDIATIGFSDSSDNPRITNLQAGPLLEKRPHVLRAFADAAEVEPPEVQVEAGGIPTQSKEHGQVIGTAAPVHSIA